MIKIWMNEQKSFGIIAPKLFNNRLFRLFLFVLFIFKFFVLD